MHYTLRQLEVFLAVARTENISRAAETLAMSQSAVSGALSELERHFDVLLFDRIGKRLQLNELGRVLWPRVENLLAQAADLELAFKQHSEIGNLNIGATLTIGNYIAVELIAQFIVSIPVLGLVCMSAIPLESARKVLNFENDLGLIEGEMQHPDLDVVPWREDELVVFCAPEHPLAVRGELSDTDLLAATWIVRESGSGTRQAFEKAMFGLLPELNIMLELQHTEAIKRAVEAGLGLGCISRVALRDALRRGSLIELRLKHRDFRRHFYFVLHRHKYRSAGIQRWLDLCAQYEPIES